jgi:sn-glycerol 3-phosphate transport system permease protein
MEKRAVFSHKLLPYLLLAPQLAITIVFFYLPASQAVRQSFFIEDAFGTKSDFVGFENYRFVFADPAYYKAIATTAIFATAVTICSLSLALLLAVMADREIKGATVYRTLLVWPYAVAPANAGVVFTGIRCSTASRRWRWSSSPRHGNR